MSDKIDEVVRILEKSKLEEIDKNSCLNYIQDLPIIVGILIKDYFNSLLNQ